MVFDIWTLLIVGYLGWRLGRGDFKKAWNDWREVIKYAKAKD